MSVYFINIYIYIKRMIELLKQLSNVYFIDFAICVTGVAWDSVTQSFVPNFDFAWGRQRQHRKTNTQTNTHLCVNLSNQNNIMYVVVYRFLKICVIKKVTTTITSFKEHLLFTHCGTLLSSDFWTAPSRVYPTPIQSNTPVPSAVAEDERASHATVVAEQTTHSNPLCNFHRLFLRQPVYKLNV